jgi:hypothetical protein
MDHFTNLYTTDLDAELTPSTSKPKSLMGQSTLSFMSLLYFTADGKPCTLLETIISMVKKEKMEIKLL